jgi:hypothetical protein
LLDLGLGRRIESVSFRISGLLFFDRRERGVCGDGDISSLGSWLINLLFDLLRNGADLGRLGSLDSLFLSFLCDEFGLHCLLLLLLELDLLLDGGVISLYPSGGLVSRRVGSWAVCLLLRHLLVDVEVGLLFRVALVECFLL